MTKHQTTRIIRVVLFVGTVIFLYFVPWVLVRAWLKPLPATIQEQVNEAIDLGFDGIIVYIDQADFEPEFYAAGWKNTEKRVAATPDALFKIASIGKLYDAVAITKLVGAGQLSLDGTLAQYFPELEGRIQYANQITLRMLVHHRSGIPNLTDTPDFWINPPQNRQEALSRILDLPADFKPDEKYKYSNTNYLLLSELIKKTTGKRDFQYIKEVILTPLGLKHTFESIHEVNLEDVMSGYYVGVDDDDIKSVYYGSMVASAEDVGIFLRALNDGSLLNTKEQAIYSSIYKYSHTGLIPGYQSIAKYDKNLDAVLVQFTNTTNFDGYNWNLSEIICQRIFKIMRNRKIRK